MIRERRSLSTRRPVVSIWFFALALLGTLFLAPMPVGQAREPGGERRDFAALLQSTTPLRIGIIGDSIAGDLGRGMQKLLAGRGNLKIFTFTKPATGLMRDDVYDWERALAGFLRKTRLNAIAVMIGGNDRQSVWMNGRRLSHGSPEWRAEYERRLARFMAPLATGKAKVYWLGLPVVRSAKMSRDYESLNRIFQAQARKHGFEYISTWETFADAKGRYRPFGPDLDGVKRRLRKNDGMHFTISGELRLANLLARAIERDLAEIEPVR
jgi:hypothetical protein